MSSIVVNKEHTFLCHKCNNLAEGIEALTKKVKSAESEVVVMIEKQFMETIRKRNGNELAECESLLPPNANRGYFNRKQFRGMSRGTGGGTSRGIGCRSGEMSGGTGGGTSKGTGETSGGA